MKPKFGIQLKLVGVLVVSIASLLLITGLSVRALRRVSESFETVNKTTLESEAIGQSLLALAETSSSIGFGLSVDDFSEIQTVRDYESEFNAASLRFELFNSALIYGSESMEFKDAQAGILYNQWKNLKLSEKYVVVKGSEESIKGAKELSKLLRPYVEKSQEAFSLKKQILRINATDGFAAASGQTEKLHALTHEIQNLKLPITQKAEEIVAENDRLIRDQVDEHKSFVAYLPKILVILALITAVITILAGLAISYFVIVKPIKILTTVAEDISKGKLDAKIDQKVLLRGDEVGSLARAFDRTMVSLKLAMRVNTSTKSNSDQSTVA